MEFKDCYEKLCECCPQVTSGTCRNYAYSMKYLTGLPDVDINDPASCVRALKDEPISRQCNCLTALKVWYKHKLKDQEKSDNLAIPLQTAKDEQRARRAKQQATPKMKKNWVEFGCLKGECKKLRDQVFSWDKSTQWTKKQFHLAQTVFLVAFHLRHPVRRDLATVNYLDGVNSIDLKKHCVRLTEYKTAKHHGPVELSMSRDSWKLFSRLRKQHKLRGLTDGHLLRNSHWGPLTKNSFTGYFSRQCSCWFPCCRDKHLGCCLLRHIVISHKKRNEMSLYEKQQLAKSMMHTTGEQELYRVTDIK